MRSLWCVFVAALVVGATPAARAQADTGVAPSGTPPSAQASEAATPGSSLPASSATVVSPDYVIGPGDSLQVSVWKEPNISGTLPVRPDGMISLPLVGDIQASGLTPSKLGDAITDRLKKSIINPVVTISVLNVKSKNIYLIGEVGKPGELPLSPGLTPLQAIASAGGLNQYANSRHIYILRGASGNQRKIPFDYKKAIKDGNLQGVTLEPGDTIVVP